MSPNILKAFVNDERVIYNSKVDLWSIGVIFYFFLTGTYLFGTGSTQEIYNKIFQIEESISSGEKFKKFSEKTQDILQKLLKVDSQKRIGWDEFFQHSIFDGQMQTEIQIDNSFSGIRILQTYQINEQFRKCSLGFSSLAIKPRKAQSMVVDFSKSGVEKDMLKESSPFVKSEIKFDFNRKDKRLNHYELSSEMIIIRSLYNHEINKYMYVFYIFQKSRHYQASPLFVDVHRFVNELMLAIFKQKKTRLEMLLKAVNSKENVLMIKNKKLFEYFRTSKYQLDLCIYFRTLNSLYSKTIKDLKNATMESRESKQSCLPENFTSGFKSYQKNLWIKTNQEMKENTDLTENVIELKHFRLFMLEVLFIHKLGQNFRFQSNFKTFCWKSFHSKNTKLEIEDIENKTNYLLKKYDWRV